MMKSPFSNLIMYSTVAFVAYAGISPARAQTRVGYDRQVYVGYDRQVYDWRRMCWQGNRQACIRFGIYLGRNQSRHYEWRHQHPDWWEWERW